MQLPPLVCRAVTAESTFDSLDLQHQRCQPNWITSIFAVEPFVAKHTLQQGYCRYDTISMLPTVEFTTPFSGSCPSIVDPLQPTGLTGQCGDTHF